MIRFIAFFGLFFAISVSVAQNIRISGTVTDGSGQPVSGAEITLLNEDLTATTDAQGAFVLSDGPIPVSDPNIRLSGKSVPNVSNGVLFLQTTGLTKLSVTTLTLDGREISTSKRIVEAGSHSLAVPHSGESVYIHRIKLNGTEYVFKGNVLESPSFSEKSNEKLSANLVKASAPGAPFHDVLAVSADGYLYFETRIDNFEGEGLDTSDVNIELTADDELEPFSFFVTSLEALRELSGNEDGFGGDLRFGETGPGAGLQGADKICATIAETSMPGSSAKIWRAFLSVTDDGTGQPVDAIDRIGEGPWYDRLGRVLAPSVEDLLHERPQNGDPAIQNDLPNENGIPNHQPDPNQDQVDNHHMLTGSDENGALESNSATCNDWTTSDGSSANGRPTCGFAWPRGGGFGGGSNWMTSFNAPGCAAGVDIHGSGGPNQGDVSVGGGGGYGGFYCFALNP